MAVTFSLTSSPRAARGPSPRSGSTRSVSRVLLDFAHLQAVLDRLQITRLRSYLTQKFIGGNSDLQDLRGSKLDNLLKA